MSTPEHSVPVIALYTGPTIIYLRKHNNYMFVLLQVVPNVDSDSEGDSQRVQMDHAYC